MEVQTLKTADGHELTINASIMVTIDDPLLMRDSVGYDDHVSNISMEARSTIQDFVSGNNLLYGLSRLDILEDLVYDALLSRTNEGVILDRLCIEDAASTSAFRLYGVSAAL